MTEHIPRQVRAFDISVRAALERDLPDAPVHDDMCETFAFDQGWGSTCLGFGGIGGQAMTSALTVVVISAGGACVYFGGRLAYVVKSLNRTFMEDLAARQMASVSGKGKYNK